MPQTPTPLNSSIPTAASSPCSSMKPTVKPKNQLSGVFSRSTMSLIFSVTLFSVCPGARIGTSAGAPGSVCRLISVDIGSASASAIAYR